MDKCCWRLKDEQSSLWYRVLSAKFGEIGCMFHLDEKDGSIWWSSLINIREGGGAGVGSDNSMCEAGDRISILFWRILD